MKTAIKTLFLLAISTNALARVGESVDECNKRYGKAIFEYSQGDWAYRTYKMDDKIIKVFYHQKVSFNEQILLGSVQIRHQSDAASYGAKSMKFFMSFLSSAYGFTQEQLGTAAKTRMPKPGVAEGLAETPAIKAEYQFVTDNSTNTVSFSIFVSDKVAFPKKISDGKLEKIFDDFLLDALTREKNARDSKVADGL